MEFANSQKRKNGIVNVSLTIKKNCKLKKKLITASLSVNALVLATKYCSDDIDQNYCVIEPINRYISFFLTKPFK